MEILILGGTSDLTGYMKPAGTYRIATELRNAGFTVQTLDRLPFCSEDYLREFLSHAITENTLLLGISTTMLQTSSAKYSHNSKDHKYFGFEDARFESLVTYAKSINPALKIVIGGAQVSRNCTPTIERFRKFIDYCVVGQGESSMVALANHLKYGNSLEFSEFDGFKFIDDKSYPVLNYDNLEIEYRAEDVLFPEETTTIEVARGCVFKCKFCTYDLIGKAWGDMIKTRRSIIEELERNYAEHGITTYICSDDTLNDSLEKVEFIHDIFTSLSFQPAFSGYFRLDILAKHRRQARLLKESGVWSMNFGIETMDKRAGALMGKGLGAERIKDTLAFLQDELGNEVILTANFIVGLPGETLDSIYSTLEYLLEPNCPIKGGNFRPLNLSRHIKGFNSELFKEAERFGYTIDPETDLWKSPIMDSAEATKITQEILTTLIARKNPYYRLIHTFYIVKLLNIGYTKSEILAMIENKPSADFSWSEIYRRTNLVHQKYLGEMLDHVKVHGSHPDLPRRSKVILPGNQTTISFTPRVQRH